MVEIQGYLFTIAFIPLLGLLNEIFDDKNKNDSVKGTNNDQVPIHVWEF